MIGTISIECNAKNPNMPLHPLRAYINSPSSLRITNVPKKIGKWNITKVTLVAIYPDDTSKTVDCVLTSGVWVGTIAGSTVAGTYTQGYTVFADGTDENGNAVTGYVLGKGDVVIMQANNTPEPEPTTTFVKLQDDGTGARDGDMYPTENGYMIQQNGEAHQVGTPFDQITAYVDTQVSSKAEISVVEELSNSLSDYYTKTETSSSSEIDAALNIKRDMNDLKVRGNPSTTNKSWFNISDGTITNNAYWYDEGRWESGQSFAVYATLTAGVYELKNYDSAWTSVGTFSLDSNYEATITNDGTTYSIIGYVGDVVVNSELSSYATKAEISAKADLSALDNKADLSDIHNDYIEDINGSSISADRSFVTVTQLSGIWQLQYGVTTNTLRGQSKTNTSYYPNEPELGDTAFQLTWGIHSSEYWTLEIHTYNGDWSQMEQYNSEAATSAATELVFPNSSVRECIYEEPQIVETGKLASQDWVLNQLDTQISLAESKIPYSNKTILPTPTQGLIYLEDRAVQAVELTVLNTTLVLPSLTNGKTNDFVVDVHNYYYDSQQEQGTSAVFSLSGTIGTDFNILVPEGESFADMTVLQYNELAEYYFTKTAFQLSSLPTWKVVKQKVETYIPETI